MNTAGIEKSKGHIAFAQFPYGNGTVIEFYTYSSDDDVSLFRAKTGNVIDICSGCRFGDLESTGDLVTRLAFLRSQSIAWEGGPNE